jgi:hypothetical protein
VPALLQRQRLEIARAAAPLGTRDVLFGLWNPPHGTFLNNLRARIIEADNAGDTAERDRLLSIYTPWAEKYLNPDAKTWSPENPRPSTD